MGSAFRQTDSRRPATYLLVAVTAAIVVVGLLVWWAGDDREDVTTGDTTTTAVVVESTEVTLTRAVEDMLAGPTAEERNAGAESWFSQDTAGMLRGVEFDEASGLAVVDFDDLRPVIPNASTSAGSQQLLEEIDAVVFGVPQVQAAEYRIEGSCDTFFEWLQFGCHTRTR